MKDKWVMLTKRTNAPKLRCLELMLEANGIESRRHGESWHAPILEVKEKDFEDAWVILSPIDIIPDDDPRWHEQLRNHIASLCEGGSNNGHGD
jgi:hypothetical protein